MTTGDNNKVFVLGLDGATFELILPWADEGKLPNLARMMTEGSYGTLRSTIPPMTAQAWTSFMTGKNMGKHGLVDFLMRRRGSYEFQIVNAMSRDGDTIWGILSRAGRRVSVVNVPMTYPPEPVNGVLVAGMDAPTPDSDFTFPSDFKFELLDAAPKYCIEPGGYRLVPGDRKRHQAFAEETWGAAEARFQATQYLLDHYPWDFFIVVFRATDRVQHWFWKHMDPRHPLRVPGDEEYADVILDTYRRMDEILGYFMERLGDSTTFVIISDHGAIPMNNRVLHLNTWLAQEGLLRFKSDARSGARVRKALISRPAWKLWRELRRSLPADMRRKLKSALPGLERKVVSHLTLADIDWSQTRAYAIEQREAIWINLAGREPQGCVGAGEEYERLRDEISAKLMGLKDPETGQAVVDKVYRREELYSGPHLDKVPDLILLLSEGEYRYRLARSSPGQKGRGAIDVLGPHQLRTDYRANAGHALDGVCLFRGKAIRPNYKIDGAQITDVAPTILHLMGHPVPNDMDGRVLADIFRPGFLADHPVVLQDVAPKGSEDLDRETYTEGEEQDVLERLQGLGYLD